MASVTGYSLARSIFCATAAMRFEVLAMIRVPLP
jgi:hypothetical protein